MIFRLGDDMAVRLPRGDWAAGQAEKEHRWLPRLAPGLPLAVPVPLGLGTPSPELGYPWHWSVSRWLDGAVPEVGVTERPESARSLSIARQLADFLTALHRLAPAGTFLPGLHLDLVRESLASRDDDTRAAIAATADVFDADAVTSAWNAALGAPPWSGGPRWFHGDFHTGNLLADPDGRLCAVIDFGGLGMGDPACDLTIAYTFLGASGRAAFRTLLATDDGTWARPRLGALHRTQRVHGVCGHTSPSGRPDHPPDPPGPGRAPALRQDDPGGESLPCSLRKTQPYADS